MAKASKKAVIHDYLPPTKESKTLGYRRINHRRFRKRVDRERMALQSQDCQTGSGNHKRIRAAAGTIYAEVPEATGKGSGKR